MSRACTRVLFLLAAVRRLSAVPGIFSDYSAASLITDIHNHYSTGCISLLYSTDMQHGLGRFMVSIEKYLSRRDILSIAVPLEKFNYTRSWAQCHRYGPLYVILSSEESTSRALQRHPPIAGPVWLLLLQRSTIEEFFRDVSVPFNCELLVAQRKGPLVELTEVYRVAEGHPLTRKLYGKWSMRRVYSMQYSDLYDRRNNLGGHVLTAAVINNPPILSVNKTAGEIVVDGYLHHLWRILEKRLNFSLKYVVPEDAMFGALKKDNSWSGMLGAVQRREADVAIGLAVSSQRVQMFAFTTPILYVGYRVYLQKPSDKVLKWENILAPFSTYLWLMAIVCWAVVSCELTALHWMGRRIGNPEQTGPPVYGFSESLLCVFGALFCQQGHFSSPQSLSCRILFLLVFYTGSVLLAAYSATLISTLATPRMVLPFTSLDDLMDDPTYRVGMAAGSALIGLFNSSAGEMGEVYKRFAADSDALPRNYTSGLQKVCKEEKYTFLMPSEIAGEMMKTIVECPIIELPKMFNKASLGNALVKNSPYLGILNVEIHKLRAVGILARLRRSAWPGLVEVEVPPLPSVDFHQVLPVIVLLFLGFVGSILVLAAELFFFRWIRRQSQDIPLSSQHAFPHAWLASEARLFQRRMAKISHIPVRKQTIGAQVYNVQ